MHKNKFITNEFFSFNQKYKVYYASCDFDCTQYNLNLFDLLDLEIPISIKNSVDKRQAEFLAGRYLATQLIKKSIINIEPNFTIPIGKNRNPIWPNGILGSITHTRNKAICLLTKTIHNSYIGVDLEEHITPKICNQIEYFILTNKDKAILKKTNLPFNIGLTLIFSAKESLFKATYPFIKEYFDFEKAEILKISLLKKIIYIKLNYLNHNGIYACHFILKEKSIQTSIYGKATLYSLE